MGVGPDIEVFGPPTYEKIPNASAHQVGRVVVLLQAVEDLECVWIDVPSRNPMVRAGDDEWGRHES
jgi:hypothetical protein